VSRFFHPLPDGLDTHPLLLGVLVEDAPHAAGVNAKPSAGSSPDVDPGVLAARVFVQDADPCFTWSETERPLDRSRPFMYGDLGRPFEFDRLLSTGRR
jgi:hypothetical protein